MSHSFSLDLSRLEKVRHTSGKVTARCPACAEGGGDRKGNHLAIFPGGYVCAAMPGEGDHNRRIFALAGIVGEWERYPERDRPWREARATEQRRIKERVRLNETIRAKRAAIIARHPWCDYAVWESSQQCIDGSLVESDARHFLASLFPQNATVWTGEVYHSGASHADRWRTVAEWLNAERAGPMTTPAIWKPGSVTRSANNVLSFPYTVLDFDGFDGKPPTAPAELEKHCSDSLAIIRWIREGLGWQLAAILWTGSKSMHAWFHTPPESVLQSLRNTASSLGIDAGLVGRPEHPCRLPGHRHEKTGKMSRVLWLQLP